MKKMIVIFLGVVLLLAGCAKEAPPTEVTVPDTTAAETTEPETTEATIPAPEVVYGIAEVNGVPAVLGTLSRGDMVDIVDSFDELHYVVKTEVGYALIEKNLLRLTEEADYEVWTGYAAYKTEFFDNYHLGGEPTQTLKFNAKVEVLEDLGSCYLVQYEDVLGYVAADKLSKHQRSAGGGDAGSGGGGGGGSPSGGADGGDISLRYGVSVNRLSVTVPQQGNVTGKAKVLVDGAQLILGYFDRGDNIPVVAEENFAEQQEGMHVIYLSGLYAYVPEELTRMEGEETYSEWDGFSKYNAVVYEDRWLRGNPVDRLNMNSKVHMLYELDNCYFVEVDGVMGFMKKTEVSKYQYSNGGGGDASGGGGGGGGGGGAEWSPPVL